MPSGKQVLLYLLQKFSQKVQNEEDLFEVSEDLRAALLLHGSTPDHMWFNVERIAWLSEEDEDGPIRQGLGLRGKNIFLSDIFESMTYDDEIPENVKRDFPNLTKDEFTSATDIMWLLLSSTQWFDCLSSVENNGQLDMKQVKDWMISYRQKMNLFRKDPADYLIGLDNIDPEYESIINEYRDKLKNIGK